MVYSYDRLDNKAIKKALKTRSLARRQGRETSPPKQRIKGGNMKMKSYKPQQNKKQDREVSVIYQIVIILLMVAVFYLMYLAFVGAIDKQFKNQDEMLCRSAERSGNIEYQNKCKGE